MSYFKFSEYEVIPKEPYRIIHNCSGCGCKMIYVNTNHFRVNANGNCIDVWMIYQCSKCKHTYNLPIYERVNPARIAKKEYKEVLVNNEKLIFQYGTNTQLMRHNKVEIAWSNISYEIVGIKPMGATLVDNIVIHNPYGLKVRTEKVVADIMQISRKNIQSMIRNQLLVFSNKSLKRTTMVQSKQEVCKGSF